MYAGGEMLPARIVHTCQHLQSETWGPKDSGWGPQCVNWKTLWHTMPPPLATNSHWTMTWVKNKLLLWQVHELSGFCFVLLNCLLPWLKLLREWATQNPWCFLFCLNHDGMFYHYYQLNVRYADILEANHDKVKIIFLSLTGNLKM